MVDRKERDILADSLLQYLRCEIDNLKLDDRISRLRTRDRLCSEIDAKAWLLYDDFRQHWNAGQWKMHSGLEATVRRWVRLLRSNMEWEAIAPTRQAARSIRAFFQCVMHPLRSLRRAEVPFVRNEFWPFENEGHWRQFESMLQPEDEQHQ